MATRFKLMRLDKAELWTCGVETLLNPSPGYTDGTEFFLSLVRSVGQSNSEKQRWLQWWAVLTQNEYNTAHPLYSCMGKSASRERFRSQPKHRFKNTASLCLISNNYQITTISICTDMSWHVAEPFGSQTVVKVSRLLAPLVSLMTQRALCVVTELFLYVIIRWATWQLFVTIFWISVE